jgi:murein DD-endopeptidase MepM/ murein hydrolase activator NlpD
MTRILRLSSWLVALSAVACAGPASAPPALERRDVVLPRDTDTIEGLVPRAATLETLLRQNQVDPSLVPSLTTAVREVFNPRHIQANRAFRVVRSLDGLFREFQYQIDTDNFLRVVFRDRTPKGEPEFEVAVVPYPREIVVDAVTAEISRERPSLIAAFGAAGEGQQLPLELANVFSGEVDFNSELQRGDVASVLFERVRRDGEFVKYGELQAAVLQQDDRQLVGIGFRGSDGKLGWYDEQGRSLKRQFLKSPLPFDPRVTSGFSTRRLHPVFGNYRAHLGVDYRAAVGTPVLSVADGTVTFAAWSGNSGRLVKVRHPGGWETMYLHLSSIATGIRPGTRVRQGQLLGRVGMSGAATGPHLDFRVTRNGKYLNPLQVHRQMPPGEPIAPEQLEAFQQVRDSALQKLRGLTGAPALQPSPIATTAANRP